MPGEARVPGPLRRPARILLGRNTLRRPSDRIEGVAVVLLGALFVIAVAAAPLIGTCVYQAQRAAAARLHPAEAVLTQNGPYNSGLAGDGQTTARWRAPDGKLRSGMLTTVTAPSIWGAPAGSQVRVWLTGAGDPASPPTSSVALMFTAIVIAIGEASGAGSVLVICYWLARLALDRRRLAAWESAWSMTGPRWTTRR